MRAGEASGRTDEALLRLAEHLERAAELRGAVINALVYPAFLLVGVLGAIRQSTGHKKQTRWTVAPA